MTDTEVNQSLFVKEMMGNWGDEIGDFFGFRNS
jgi:hypothetical protein